MREFWILKEQLKLDEKLVEKLLFSKQE